MLYLIDEYIAKFPNRQHTELLRFKTCDKYLHEMTLSEVNEIVSRWNPTILRTIRKTKQKIGQYLDWLCNEKGQTIHFNIMAVEFPTKDDVPNDIFSTKDIQMYYDILYMAVERMATLNGTNALTKAFRMTHAAGILAFYGLSDEQILALDLSDVQPDGVAGYYLPLTSEDIKVLMDYKNMKINGTKFIRSDTFSGKTTDAYFLNRPLSKALVEEKYAYVKTLLKTSQLNLFGKFNDAYLMEKDCAERIPDIGKIPDWFKNIFKVSPNWLTKIRKQYIEYRKNRDAYELDQIE